MKLKCKKVVISRKIEMMLTKLTRDLWWRRKLWEENQMFLQMSEYKYATKMEEVKVAEPSTA